MAPAERSQAARRLGKLLAGQEVPAFLLTLRAANGQWVPCQVRLLAKRDDSGQVQSIHAICTASRRPEPGFPAVERFRRFGRVVAF